MPRVTVRVTWWSQYLNPGPSELKHSFHPLIWLWCLSFLFSVTVLVFIPPRAFAVKEGSWTGCIGSWPSGITLCWTWLQLWAWSRSLFSPSYMGEVAVSRGGRVQMSMAFFPEPACLICYTVRTIRTSWGWAVGCKMPSRVPGTKWGSVTWVKWLIWDWIGIQICLNLKPSALPITVWFLPTLIFTFFCGKVWLIYHKVI